jgi:trimethylamine--corrinoid protein Co-methyltransferase
MRGIEVTEESIAAESIMEVGPGGNFLMEDLTLENLYTDEFFQPTIRMNLQYESWMAAGASTVDVVASRMAKDILAKGNPVPLDGTVSEELNRIIGAFEKVCSK